MFHSRPAPIAALLGALAVLDLLVVGQVAGAADEAQSPTPSTLPDEAFLTGRDRPGARVQGVQARIEATKGGYRLHLTNTSEERREVDLEVLCFKQMGSPMSRMGPRRTEASSDRVVASLAAGESHTQKLGCTRPERGDENSLRETVLVGGFEGAFEAADFEIYAAADRARVRDFQPTGRKKLAARPAPARPLARLRLSRDLKAKKPRAAATAATARARG